MVSKAKKAFLQNWRSNVWWTHLRQTRSRSAGTMPSVHEIQGSHFLANLANFPLELGSKLLQNPIIEELKVDDYRPRCLFAKWASEHLEEDLNFGRKI